MKRALIGVISLFVFQICAAPVLNFESRMSRFRSAVEYANNKHHEKEFNRLIQDLGWSESLNNWMCINCIGCFGEWQFSESTLRFLGYRKITLKKFRKDPEIFPRDLQLEALKGLIKVNMSYLRDYQHFIGDTINNVVITKSGMIAASHLGGAGSLMKFLRSDGKINRKDVLGTSIGDYLRKFSSYELD